MLIREELEDMTVKEIKDLNEYIYIVDKPSQLRKDELIDLILYHQKWSNKTPLELQRILPSSNLDEQRRQRVYDMLQNDINYCINKKDHLGKVRNQNILNELKDIKEINPCKLRCIRGIGRTTEKRILDELNNEEEKCTVSEIVIKKKRNQCSIL